jgi:hypothetical protein
MRLLLLLSLFLTGWYGGYGILLEEVLQPTVGVVLIQVLMWVCRVGREVVLCGEGVEGALMMCGGLSWGFGGNFDFDVVVVVERLGQ